MLPKPEKPTRKNAKSGEQLDLVKEIDVGKKVESKRKTVIFLLIATIGLSIVFAVYRSVKIFIASPSLPQFTLPNINPPLPVVNNSDIDAQIKQIINPSLWSVQVISIQDTPLTLYSLNPSFDIQDNLSPLLTDLSTAPPFPDSPIVDIMPEGIEYHQKLSTEPDYFIHQLLVTLPQKQLLFITQLKSPDTTLFKESLPKLIETLYWYSIKIK